MIVCDMTSTLALEYSGLFAPFPNENVEFDKFIRKPAEFLDVGVDEGEGTLGVCLVSTVLTVTVVPAGIFLVNDSAFFDAS